MNSKEYLTNKKFCQKSEFLLENGLKNVLQYIKTPVEKNIDYCLGEIAKMNRRRGLDSKIFTEFYKELNVY